MRAFILTMALLASMPVQAAPGRSDDPTNEFKAAMCALFGPVLHGKWCNGKQFRD